MSYASSIVEKFGGTRAAASALSLPPSTVQSWKDSGFIPARHHQRVLEIARATNIALTPADFFDVEGEASPRTGSAA